MCKRTNGYLTVEATIVLTTFLFFMMFLMNMGQVYRAQNYVAHGLLQTGKLLSFSNYDYNVSVTEMLTTITRDSLLDSGVSSKELMSSWGFGNYTNAVKTAFLYCAGIDPAATNETLIEYGLKNGIDTIDFLGTGKEDGDLVIQAKYRVDLPFAFFNIDHIDLKQQVRCGLWG